MKLVSLGILLLVITLAAGGLIWKIPREIEVPPVVQEAPVFIPEIDTGEVHSGDGVMNLTYTSTELEDGSTNYVFRVTKRSDNSQRELFSKTVGAGVKMELSENSWSPDNKQVFVVEKEGGITRYFVYKADGTKYKNGEEFLEILELWGKSGIKYVLRMVTGWEGNDLLGVKTRTSDGSAGPTYWFVVSSRNFMMTRRL